MTTDTVHAADLAAALREAVKDQRYWVGECQPCYGAGWVWNDEFDTQLTCRECSGSGIAGDYAPRWQALLDRWDALCREEIDQLIRDRDQYMRLALETQRGDWPSWYVRQSRAVNHQALAIRRQLRAMGGEP